MSCRVVEVMCHKMGRVRTRHAVRFRAPRADQSVHCTPIRLPGTEARLRKSNKPRNRGLGAPTQAEWSHVWEPLSPEAIRTGTPTLLSRCAIETKKPTLEAFSGRNQRKPSALARIDPPLLTKTDPPPTSHSRVIGTSELTDVGCVVLPCPSLLVLRSVGARQHQKRRKNRIESASVPTCSLRSSESACRPRLGR